jgi:hypothetical protein
MVKKEHTIRLPLVSVVGALLIPWTWWMVTVLMWHRLDQARPAESIVVLGSAA